MANNYISIKTIADKLLRHPMMAGISFEAIIDYTVDFMRIIQCYNFFVEKCIDLTIDKYRCKLPEDFYEINQLKLKNRTIQLPVEETDDIPTEEDVEEPMCELDPYPIVKQYPKYEIFTYSTTDNMFKYSSDSFHLSDDKTHIGVELTYKIQGNILYTSIESGEVELSYQAMPIDEEGYPLIPDNSKFSRALEAYIKKQWFTILFDMGKLQGAILQNVQQEYAWAVGACESDSHNFTMDKAETFFNSWRSLLMNTKRHSTGFVNKG